MVRERGYRPDVSPESRSNQFGAKLKRDRVGREQLPEDAADAVNRKGYPDASDPVTGRPVGKITAEDWNNLEAGQVVPKNGGGFIDSYISGGLGREDDRETLEKRLAHDVLHPRLGSRTNDLVPPEE